MLKTISKMLIPCLVVIGLVVIAAQPVSAVSKTLYVEGGLTWVDYGDNNGSKDFPYLTINDALSHMDSEGGTIIVAKGTYTEDIDLQNLDSITIAGSYNQGVGGYTVQSINDTPTSIDGAVTGTNIDGTLTGLVFGGQSGIASFVDIDLAGSGYSFTVDGCIFFLGDVTEYAVKIGASSGSNGAITNNRFGWFTSTKSMIETNGGNGTVVTGNYFDQTQSTNGSYGLINATDGAKVINNLIEDSGGTNRVAIRVLDQAQVYNNTIVGGTALTGAIATSGTDEHNVYNNLVANVTGTAFVWATVADEMTNFTDADCDPAFVGGDPGAEGYKLGASSTCRDAGTTVSSANTDYFGTSRPSGGGYDIGFHEFYVVEACGNSFLEGTEECDDGNTVNGDECSSICEYEDPMPVVGVCGDGTVDAGEQCDDGNTVSGDNCSSTCQDEASPIPPGGVVPCGDWHDINSSDEHYAIAVYLCEHGEIILGDSFGNLRIDDDLTRAELLAMAFRAREYKGLGVVDENAEACFNDVIDDWYAMYFCTAKIEGFVEGYEGNLAKPGNIVLLAEGLKMFMGALDKYYIIDEGDCWYCSMIWQAEPHDWLPFTFVSPTDIGPNELSRRYAMDMLYRILTNN